MKQFRLKGKKITFSQHNLVSMTYSAVIYSVCIYSRSLLEQSLLLITTETNNKMSQSELEGKIQVIGVKHWKMQPVSKLQLVLV